MKRSYVAGALLALALTGCGPNSTSSGSRVSNGMADATAPLATKPVSDHVEGLPKGDLSWANLKDAVGQSRAYTPPDQFSKPFDTSALIGRHFSIHQPVPNVWWKYDVSKEHLIFTIYPTEVVDVWVNYLAVEEIEQSLGSSEASNAFGARVNVDSTSETDYGLGQPDDKAKLGLFPWTGFDYKNLQKTINLSPDKARNVTSGLTFTLTGIITAANRGEVIHCYSHTFDATINNPHQRGRTDCVIAAHLTSLSIQNGSDIVGSWKSRPTSVERVPDPQQATPQEIYGTDLNTGNNTIEFE